MSDFTFTNHGSICVLTPVSMDAKIWRDDFLPAFGDDCQGWGRDGIVIEPRYAGDILEGIAEAGLTVGGL